MFKKIGEFLGNQVTMTVNGSEVHFQGTHGSVALGGYVIISLDEKPIVLALGEPYAGKAPFKKIEVLPLKERYRDEEVECLESFFKYAISKVSNAFIRPMVYVKNSGTNFNKPQKDFLTRTFTKAGAREIFFWNHEHRKFE